MVSAPRDSFNRTIDYLRVSITDRCNFRCAYCMPPEGIRALPHKGILSYEEIVRVVGAAISCGISQVRITGGEPLVRRDVTRLIAAVRALDGLRDLSLTTNGALLSRLAGKLAEAGLNRVNISLDSLRPERFSRITRGGDVSRVLAGIEAAFSSGLGPIKVNVVPIRGFNDDELGDFAALTLNRPFDVRFIEFMPTRGSEEFWSAERMIPSEEIVQAIERVHGPMDPAETGRGGGPARYFSLRGAAGRVGVITPVSNHFCAACNRLRLTADGRLKPCLFSDDEIDLMPSLRRGEGSVEESIRRAIEAKPERRTLRPPRRPMSRIGG